MAQAGDTITYTHDGDTDGNGELIPEEVDVSAVDEITIQYVDGAGSTEITNGGGNGGRVEGTVVDVSAESTVYIWVALGEIGRYDGGGNGGGSTEISFVNTDSTSSTDEPFVVGAGGGGKKADKIPLPGAEPFAGDGGARGGIGGDDTSGGGNDGNDGEGVAPPLGGDGGDYDGSNFEDGTPGDGAVANISEIIETGTTTLGGGSSSGIGGEVKITYGKPVPNAPTNLSATLK